jgi:DNA polymerase I-like protein with 3'-5' exonuclease and polymerase domains/uracil-DNA glycosylase
VPFVGASGSWLRGKEFEPGKRSGGLLAAAGLRDSECSRANTLGCRPPDNVYPTDAAARDYISSEDAHRAVEHCYEAHLKPVLLDRAWERIVPLGDKALHVVCDVPDGPGNGIMRWRGSPLPVRALEDKRPRAVATLHPAFLARSQELMPAVVNDLRKSLQSPPEYYNTHPSLDEVRAFVATAFAADIETIRGTGQITMVGLSDRLYHAICVPFEGAYINELKRIFAAATLVVGHNCLQFDLPILREQGVDVPAGCQILDTMLLQHLLQPDLPHGLDFLGSFFTSKPAWKHLSGSDEELYCCRDTDVTWQCAQQLQPLLKYEKLWDLYQNVSVPLARICHLMTQTGFRIDPSRLKKVRAELEAQAIELEGLLPEGLRTHSVPVRKRQLAPAGTVSDKTGKPLKYIMVEATEEETPWKSTQILSQYLYEEKKLAVQTHAKTGQPTVDKTALPKLLRKADEETRRAIRALQQLRVIASLTSTFVKEKWETNAIERIHASFNVHGTASGRLSSSDPNLQNIPESARYIYVPSFTDWRIFDVDFSSLENRLTAHFAHDLERLERLSQPGFNEHKWVCSQFFNIPIEEVIKDNSKDAPYGKAKRINHGSNYGMGPMKISKLYDLPYAEMKELCDKWKRLNAKTVEWQNETAARAKKDGFLVTPFGRKRWFYTQSAHTEALSFLPQSTGADITFLSMLALLHERIGWSRERVERLVPIVLPLPRPAQILAQVHDSLPGEAPIDIIAEVREVMQRIMGQPWPQLGGFSIPAEWKEGPSWGECK